MLFMRNEQRYTAGQKVLLSSVKWDKLSAEEKDLLRRCLLPRTKYLPRSDEEGREIALQMLDTEKYDAMFRLVEDICAQFGELTCGWARGDEIWELYYSLRRKSSLLCRIGLALNVFYLVIPLNHAECERFEAERDKFPRMEIQWNYDMAPLRNGQKYAMFDVSDPAVLPYLFRLLSYKQKPKQSCKN